MGRGNFIKDPYDRCTKWLKNTFLNISPNKGILDKYFVPCLFVYVYIRKNETSLTVSASLTYLIIYTSLPNC